MTIKVKIQEGSVVRLKSGGPWMTAADDPEDDLVTCVWFPDHGHEPHSDDFGLATLETKDEDQRLHEALDATTARLKEVEGERDALRVAATEMFAAFASSNTTAVAPKFDALRALVESQKAVA
jgi:uncharacterized protein YodC (DUF2158 family)